MEQEELSWGEGAHSKLRLSKFIGDLLECSSLKQQQQQQQISTSFIGK